VTPNFQKGEKKRNKFSKLLIFSTDCSQSMGLHAAIRAENQDQNFETFCAASIHSIAI
jgi:hypothetical protein